jgi:hypothetical protein
MSYEHKINEFRTSIDSVLTNIQESTITHPMTEAGLEKLLNDIIKNCQPFLKTRMELFRGMEATTWNGHKEVRTDRQPRDSSDDMHKFHNLILKDLKLPLRDEVLFAVTNQNYNMLVEYGKTRMIFPTGNFSFYWFPDIVDAYTTASSVRKYIEKFSNIKKAKNINEVIDSISSIPEDGIRPWAEKALEELLVKFKKVETSKFPDKKNNNEISISTKGYYFLPTSKDLPMMLSNVKGYDINNENIMKSLITIYGESDVTYANSRLK